MRVKSQCSRKYLTKDADGKVSGVRWDNLHVRNRKIFKYNIRRATRDARKQIEMYNKYCGQEGILCIHGYTGDESIYYRERRSYENEAWYVDMVKDAYGRTCSDIYIRLSDEVSEEVRLVISDYSDD